MYALHICTNRSKYHLYVKKYTDGGPWKLTWHMLWGPIIKSSILHPELCMRNSVQLLITCMSVTFIALGLLFILHFSTSFLPLVLPSSTLFAWELVWSASSDHLELPVISLLVIRAVRIQFITPAFSSSPQTAGGHLARQTALNIKCKIKGERMLELWSFPEFQRFFCVFHWTLNIFFKFGVPEMTSHLKIACKSLIVLYCQHILD